MITDGMLSRRFSCIRTRRGCSAARMNYYLGYILIVTSKCFSFYPIPFVHVLRCSFLPYGIHARYPHTIVMTIVIIIIIIIITSSPPTWSSIRHQHDRSNFVDCYYFIIHMCIHYNIHAKQFLYYNIHSEI
jgi:hypothetical protein